MSDMTSKIAEANKKATDQLAKTGQQNIETAGRTAKEAVGETSQVAQHNADRVRQVGQSVTDTMTETANAATDLSTKAADQGREALMMGMRTAAGLGSRVADINFGRSRHMMSSAAHAMDVYRDASERSAERVQALFSSVMIFSRGVQSMQQAWLEMLDQKMETAAHKPQDLLRCQSLTELAEVQRDLYLDAVNHAFEASSRLLEMAGRTAQDAVRPLRS